MSELSQVGVGIVGMGFMGATHFRAYQAAAEAGFQCRIIGVSDQNPERLLGFTDVTGNLGSAQAGRLFDPTQLRTTRNPHDLFSDPRIHLVSICTHTDTHAGLAMAAMRAGKHVLIEKPVALTSAEVRRVAEVARETGRLCMPAMCMRFWPGWNWLRERIRDERFGRVTSAVFHRLGSGPTWSREFYGDHGRSGGALMDLHIHDADFICWCFGRPREVVTIGSLSHLTTIYRFPESGPPHVVAEGAQDHAPGFGFRMRYTVCFEKATADFDLSRTPRLCLAADGKSQPVDVPQGAGYDGQIRHLIDAILGGRGNEHLLARIDEAVSVAEVLEAERRSLETDSPVLVKTG